MAAKKRLINLKTARVLISNDDGIHAPGIKLLEKVVSQMCGDVWVVAPESEQSATSHSLTVRRPLRIREVSKRHFAADGTPTDSVLLASREILKDNPPDLVLSGVNRGANLGEDVTYSGTVAAAMEATLLGIPSVAFSLVTDDRAAAKWATVEHWLPKVLKKLEKFSWPPSVLVNVNFPDRPAKSVTGIRVIPQGRRKIGGDLHENLDPRGVPYYWIGAQRDEVATRGENDLSVVNAGGIAVTPLSLEMTHTASIKALKDIFPAD